MPTRGAAPPAPPCASCPSSTASTTSSAPGGWDADLERTAGAGPGHTVRCRLRVGAVRRAGLAEAPDLDTAIADALRRAAGFYGIGPGLGGSDVLALATDEAGAPDWDAARAALVARGAVVA